MVRCGAGSVVLAFFSKQGCYSRSEKTSQKLDDTEVPTASLRDLQQSVLKLRNDLRSLPLDSSNSVSTDRATQALANVSLIQVPQSMKMTGANVSSPPEETEEMVNRNTT